MRVVHLPFHARNPYQHKLAEGLGRHGVSVVAKHQHTWRLLDRMLSEWHADAIHFHWLERFVWKRKTWRLPMDFVCLIVQLAVLRLLGKRIVWTVHNLKGHENEHPWREWIIAWLIGRMSHAIFVHGEYARQAAIREFRINPKKIVVIPHGHYGDCYPNEVTPADAKQRLGLDLNKQAVLFLGNIRPYKGVEQLIADFRDLQQNDAELVIAGRPFSNELAEELRRLAKGDARIHLHLDFVPDDELQVFMNAADVVVFPYRDILTSGAVVLAMTFGRACIAPRLGCITEVLDEKGAFLYEPDQPDALAQCLSKTVAAKSRLSAMGEHNRERAMHWDWERIAAMTASAYRGPADQIERWEWST